MSYSRLRITIRGILVAVALIALNLAAAMTTLKHYRPPKSFTYVSGFNENENSITVESKHVYYYNENTLLQVWLPVIASVAVSLLVLTLIVAAKGYASRRRIGRGVARTPSSLSGSRSDTRRQG